MSQDLDLRALVQIDNPAVPPATKSLKIHFVRRNQSIQIGPAEIASVVSGMLSGKLSKKIHRPRPCRALFTRTFGLLSGVSAWTTDIMHYLTKQPLPQAQTAFSSAL